MVTGNTLYYPYTAYRQVAKKGVPWTDYVGR